MSHLFNSDQLFEFLHSSGLRENDIARELRQVTMTQVEHAHMMTTPLQAQFLSLLVSIIQPTHAIEVGVFTGYGTLAIATAMPDNGQLIACDIGEQWPSIGKPFWQQAGVSEKIDLRIGNALDTLRSILNTEGNAAFDFMFIDADKNHYNDYYDLALQLLRPGGVIVFDNVIRIHHVYVHEQATPGSRVVYQLCHDLKNDDRVDVSTVPIGEGMLIARKR